MRKIYTAAGFLFASINSAVAIDVMPVGLYEPSGDAVNIIGSLYDDRGVVYINARLWLNDNSQVALGLANAKQNIKTNHARYLIDFSHIDNEADKQRARDIFRQKFGLSFKSNFVAISLYNRGIMFTELSGSHDSNLAVLNPSEDVKVKTRTRRDTSSSLNTGIPSVSYYYNATKQISNRECQITSNTFDGAVTVNLCKNANISLVYKVNMQRSLAYGTMGAATPDAKLVRIGIDDSATGSGISLNDSLYGKYLTTRGVSWPSGGDEAEWTTSAIAQDYTFDFTATNDKASILRTIPASNLNSNYSNTESSSFQFGISGGVEVSSVDAPKASLSASASWTESTSLTFQTFDYEVKKSSNNPQHVSFSWLRDQYKTSQSIIDAPIYGFTAKKRIPAHLDRINPVGYANFLPKMEVIYKADPQAVGTTEVHIDSSVNITGYRYYSWVRPFITLRYYYSKDNDVKTKRINKRISFTVDWDHPVFTGGRPVNLQMAAFNNRCIDVNTDGTLSSDTCVDGQESQGFIYDELQRYASVSHPKMCIDGEDVTALVACNLNQSQRWEWTNNKMNLQNKFTGELLGYSEDNGILYSTLEADDYIKAGLLSSYIDVFSVN